MVAEIEGASREAQIRAAIDAWAKAIHDRNADGVVAALASDFTLYSLAPPLASTGTGTEDLEAWFATWQSPVGCEIRDLNITAGDDTAYCFGLARMSGTKKDGEKVDLWFRLTFGFRRFDSGWRIAHMHESVPFRMDGSYRAALDLQP